MDIGFAMLDPVLKVTVLLALVLGLAAALRGTSAAVRHFVLSLGLVGVLVVPLISRALPWRLHVLPAVSAVQPAAPVGVVDPVGRGISTVTASPIVESVVERGATSSGPATPGTPGESNTVTAPMSTTLVPSQAVAEAPRLDWRRLIVTLWLVGAGLVFSRLLIGIATVWRLARSSRPLHETPWIVALRQAARRLGLATPVRLLRSDRISVPFTLGFRNPAILLPAEATAWPADRRESVLLHELAHVVRRDLLTHLLAQAACAVYWFHPLVWLAARRLRMESERACDDFVLRAGTGASQYAGHLLEIVTAGQRRLPVVVLPMAQRSEFEGRVLAILAPGIKRHGLSLANAIRLALVMLLVALPVAALGPASAASEEAGRDGRDGAPSQQVPPPAAPRARPAPEQEQQSVPRVRLANVPKPPMPADLDLDLDWDMDTPPRMALDAHPAPWPEARLELDPWPIIVDAIASASASATAWRIGTEQRFEFSDRIIAQLSATLRDVEAEVRLAAVEALADLEDARAVTALVSTLRDEVVEIRREAVQALGQIADTTAVQALIRTLSNDADAQVRRVAAWSLGQIEDRRATAALGQALRQDQDVEVRKQAAWALGQLEDPAAVDALGAATQDANVEVARQAVWALGQIEDPRAVPALQRALGSSDVETRRQAAWALGQIENAEAVTPLLGALRDADASVRQQAAWALGQIEDARAVPGLTTALRDANIEVKRQAARALGQIEDPSAAPGLVAALRDDDVQVRRQAAAALGQLELTTLPDGLLEAMRDADPEVRRYLVRSLSRVEGQAAVDFLLGALQDQDPEVRRMAAQALGRRRF